MLSPWDAIQAFSSGLSLPSLAWGVFTLVAVFALWRLSVRKRGRPDPTWMTVVWWLIGLLGWCFYMYVAGWSQIAGSPVAGTAIVLLVAAAIGGVAYTLLQRRDRVALVVSGGITGTVGFGLLATIASNNSPWFFAVFLGLTLGSVGGQLLGSLRILTGGIVPVAPDDEPNTGDDDRAAGRKLWDEINKAKPPKSI